MSNRSLSWNSALRELRADRAARHDIREERLRTTAGLRSTPTIALTAWRGRSGRRYIAGAYTVAEARDLLDALPAVVLAVTRDATGIASIISLRSYGANDGRYLMWLAAVTERGATEIHVHRLTETAAERAAMVADLTAVRASVAA